jgi:hypothetical protein
MKKIAFLRTISSMRPLALATCLGVSSGVTGCAVDTEVPDDEVAELTQEVAVPYFWETPSVMLSKNFSGTQGFKFTQPGLFYSAAPAASGNIHLKLLHKVTYIPNQGDLVSIQKLQILCTTDWIGEQIKPVGGFWVDAFITRNGVERKIRLTRDTGAGISQPGTVSATYNLAESIPTAPGDRISITANCTLTSRADGVTPRGPHMKITW